MAPSYSAALVLSLALLSVFAPSADASMHRRFDGKLVTKNLVTALLAKKQYGVLIEMLVSSGLVNELPDLFNHYEATIFAPTDAAFKALPKATSAALAKDPLLLREIVFLHFVKGKRDAKTVIKRSKGHEFETAAEMGDEEIIKTSVKGAVPVYVSAKGGKAVKVVAPDAVKLRVVMVHGIGGVIVPNEPKKAEKKLTLKQAFDNINDEEDQDNDN